MYLFERTVQNQIDPLGLSTYRCTRQLGQPSGTNTLWLFSHTYLSQVIQITLTICVVVAQHKDKQIIRTFSERARIGYECSDKIMMTLIMKNNLSIHNLIILLYVISFSLLSFLVSDKFMYFLWVVTSDNLSLFIYIPLILLLIQLYFKHNKIGFTSYTKIYLLINAIIMLILSFFVFYFIFLSFFYKGEGIQ